MGASDQFDETLESYGTVRKYRIRKTSSFNSGASLGLHGGCPIPPATSEDREAHGAQGPDSGMPAREAMVFSPVRLGCIAANQCKLFTEGQQGCAATLL